MGLKKTNTTAVQTSSEELANAITHGIGMLLSVWGFVILSYKAIIEGTVWHRWGIGIYGLSLCFLYLSSTCYHAIAHEKIKKIFRRLDHISIYMFIFGCYAPITLVALHGVVGWTLLGIECGLCLLGVLLKIYFGHRYEIFSVLFYLLMGWMAVLAIGPMLTVLPLQAFLWILVGGLCYSFGVIFYAYTRRYAYFHAIWHLFVLAGSICHFLMILFYIIPFRIS